VLGLDELDEEALMEILTKPKNAITRQYQKLFSMEGIRLTFTRDALREVVRIAQSKKIGARGLRSVLESALMPIMFEAPSQDNIREILVTREAICREAEPVYSYKKDKKIA
jgi:ATP-dependent Clp protease ATP-binding subunit ClpX